MKRGRAAVTTLSLALLTTPSASAADLAERIQSLLDVAPIAVRGSIGIHVVELTGGKTLFAKNEDDLFLPASNMKLFTVALALSRLGPGYRFETRLVKEASGDVILVGSGDPTMSARPYPSQSDGGKGTSLQAIEELADQAIANGLKRVDGDIIGDDSRYAWEPYPPSWTTDDMTRSFGAPVSALTLNDNTLTVTVRPGAGAGQLAKVTISPQVEYFAIDNRVNTVTGRGPTPLRMSLLPGTRQLLLTGTLNTAAGATQGVFAVDDPALLAATAMYDALLRRGVAIHGRPRARHRPISFGPAVVVQGELLSRRVSPPLQEILWELEKVSQNLHAEIMLREVGAAIRKEGTLAGGLKEMSTFLVESKVSLAGWTSEDASGLGRNDEVAPNAMTRLLRFMYATPYRDVWLSFLPVGGVDGTLSKRMCCVVPGPFAAGYGVDVRGANRIHGKTGTLARAVALSGYAESPTLGYLAFSIFVNNYAAPIDDVRDWVDKVALSLVQ